MWHNRIEYTRVIIFNLVFTICIICCDGKNNSHGNFLGNGVYQKQEGLGPVQIEIRNDTMIMYEWVGATEYISFITEVARCKIKKEGNDLYEISSIGNPKKLAFENMVITRFQKDTADSCEIKFILPNMDRKVRVICQTKRPAQEREVINNECVFKLGYHKYYNHEFSFGVLYNGFRRTDSYGQFSGIIYFSYHDYIEFKPGESITIELPDITTPLFETYYINKEYVKKFKNGFKWRGNVYTNDLIYGNFEIIKLEDIIH